MRLSIKKFIFLLSVLLVSGMIVAGWALAFHFAHTAKNAESLIELINTNPAVNVVPLALDRNNIVLVLFCIGMIGFFGVRRQRKASENFVRLNHPESKSHADSINDNKLPTL